MWFVRWSHVAEGIIYVYCSFTIPSTPLGKTNLGYRFVVNVYNNMNTKIIIGEWNI
jgi:hypothetical protein